MARLRKRLGKPAKSRFDRAVAVTLVTGIGLLLMLGLVFSIAYGSQQITTKASGLHDADEALRSATVVRAQVGLSVHLTAVDRALGSFSGEAIELSVDEAKVALGDMQTGVAKLDSSDALAGSDVTTAAAIFATTAEEAIGYVETRDDRGATSMNASLNEDFRSLVVELEGIRDQLAASVANSDALLGRIGNIARFLVAFLIPAAIIFIYRELLLRSHRQRELEARLEWERQLSRAREEFIANASHELRTPLTGIAGLAQLLAEEPTITQSESASELLDLIISESADLGRMVEDLLTTARLDAGALHFNFEDTDICEAIDAVVQPMVKAGLAIQAECEPALVRSDVLRFHQVLRNLLSNARKYGGATIQLRGRVEGRTYACSVIDDGPGIPDDVHDRLFQRFVHQGQAPTVKGSVGLGLSIVQALAQGMGGSVTYTRRDSQTWFTLRLPLADRDALAELASSNGAMTGLGVATPSGD